MTNIPTDEQIDELWDEVGSYFNLYPEVRNIVREALRRWGNVEELKQQIEYLEWRAYGEE
jgi:hypothetical protein